MLSASCECAGGAAPAGCKHVFAVLALVQEYCTKELYSAPTEVIQRWHEPSKKKRFEAAKIKDLLPKEPKVPNDTSVNFAALKNLSKQAPIFSVLNDPQFNITDIVYKKSIPLPAVVMWENLYKNVKIPEFLGITELCFYHSNVKKTLDECYDIEMRTLRQNDEFWKEQRVFRITASNF